MSSQISADPQAASQNARTLIMTVGLMGEQGGDVIDALAMDLETLRPERLALIASKESQANARRMKERSGLPDDHCQIVVLEGAHDIDEIFRQTSAVIQRLVAQGYSPDQIAINYTSGTKVMGSGAVLAAVYHRVNQLRYITGLAAVSEGPERKRRHRILTTRPSAVLAYQELLRGRGMILELHFRSAHVALDGIEEDLLTAADRTLRRSLSQLAHAFEVWDNFDPVRFLELYRTVDVGHKELTVFRFSEEKIQALEQVGQEIKASKAGPFTIVDMYNNATRRTRMGRTSDGMARLYRALEMLAQWVLDRDFHLDTNDVDTRRIPPRDRVAFEALRSLDEGMVRVGLRKAYDLLDILGVAIGREIRSDPVMRDFFRMRSRSILAHGLDPGSLPDLGEFLSHVRKVFLMEIPDFDTLAQRLQFPWLEY